MFHSNWKKMHGLRSRVKAILDVYCEVLMKGMNEDETRKALELLCPNCTSELQEVRDRCENSLIH